MSKFIEKYSNNDIGRDFILSDLHGCYEDLINKLTEVNFDYKKDRVFSVGDLCDRGPHSGKCLQLVYEDWFIPVFGNHEWLWARAHDEFYKLGLFGVGPLVGRFADYQIFISNGGEIIDPSDNFTMKDLKELVKTIISLPRAIELETKSGGRVGIIHAELPFSDWEQLYDANEFNFLDDNWQDWEEHILWGRSMCMYKPDEKTDYTIKNIDRVYAGHTIVPEVKTVANRVYIETGCFWKYKHPHFTEEKKKQGFLADLTLLEV